MLARITLTTRPDAILIPEESVMAEGRSTFVYRIAGTPAEPRAERIDVRIGQRRVGEVEVVEGLTAGDRVVTAGLQRLRLRRSRPPVRASCTASEARRGAGAMISDLSIKRPVLAIVLSALIVVIGIAALLRLPVRELPDVDTAVVTVTTTYEGAAPEIIDTEVIEILEGAISGVDGIRSIRSSSRLGRGRIVVEFVTSRDIDQAANDVRDAVGRVLVDLPDEADTPEIVKTDSDAQPILRIAVISDRMTPADINDYASRFIVDRLSVLNGVAQVEIFGERRYAIRIWLNREALAAREPDGRRRRGGASPQQCGTAGGRAGIHLPPVHRAHRHAG